MLRDESFRNVLRREVDRISLPPEEQWLPKSSGPSAPWLGLAIAAAGVVVLLIALSVARAPEPSVLATPTPLTTSGSDPRTAVSLLLPGSASSPCYGPQEDQLYRRARGCPITVRLEQKLHSSAVAGFNPVCRCQSFAPIDVGQANISGGTATVSVTFRTPTPYVITFLLATEGQDWRVDDTWCGTDRSTTIYATPVVTCGG
jgi:hypothetical protein